MPDVPRSIATALAAAAREINASKDVDAMLDTIVRVAKRDMPDIDMVGISIAHRDGRVETRAATDDLVHELDNLQYELHEGPCVHSIEAEPVVLVEDLRHEQRWPAYVPLAVRRGLRAQLGLRLYVEDETLGGLNMYSLSSDTIGAETRELAEIFAAHAALTLGRVRKEDQLTEALASRKLIGQAIGIVMERFSLDEDRAFQYLSRVSQHGNVKLRAVAEELVGQRNRAAEDD